MKERVTRAQVREGSPSAAPQKSPAGPVDPQAVHQRLIELLALAENHWGREFPFPQVRFDLRGLCAGQALQRDNCIRINLTLFRENVEQYLRQTVGHELAHLVCWHVHGHRVRPHGAEWRQVMHVFGLPAQRCHTYDTARSRGRRVLTTFPYQCRCRIRQMTIIRHRRMLRRPGYYSCIQCGEKLRPLDGV